MKRKNELLRHMLLPALACMFAAPVSCVEQLAVDNSGTERLCEDYRPGYRVVEAVMAGPGDFLAGDTKGAITSAGRGGSTWNASETKINSWKIGVYDCDGALFSQSEGTGTPGSMKLRVPQSGSYRILAYANLPSAYLDDTYSETSARTFGFSRERLISDGVPARADCLFSEEETLACIYLDRMVSKVNLKLNNLDFPSFQATEVSLHSVALDSRNGAVGGYQERDFDCATASELANLNVASDTGYSVAFICPSNEKGTVPNGNPVLKDMDHAPANATYLEVRGNVADGGYGSGEVVYRFFLGANATSDYNLKPNYIYNVTLNVSEGNLPGYVDGSTWKVDLGGFDFTGYDWWWVDRNTGTKSRTMVHSTESDYQLLVRVPKYELDNDVVGVSCILFGSATSCNTGDWWSSEYADRNVQVANESTICSPGGIPEYDVYYGEYMDWEGNDPCFVNRAVSHAGWLNSAADLSSHASSYTDFDNYDDSYMDDSWPHQHFRLGWYRISGAGADVFSTVAGTGSLKDWICVDIDIESLANVSVSPVDSDPAWITIYRKDDGSIIRNIPLYFMGGVGGQPPQMVIEKDDDWCYIGQYIKATAANLGGSVSWSVVDGDGCIGLSGTSGSSVNIICKGEGQAKLKATGSAGSVTQMVTVKRPTLRTSFDLPKSSGTVHDYGSLPGYAQGLYLDGVPNEEITFWYTGEESGGPAKILTFRDRTTFLTYVGTRLTKVSGSSFSMEFAPYVDSDGVTNYGRAKGLCLLRSDTYSNQNTNERNSMYLYQTPGRYFLEDLTGNSGYDLYPDLDHYVKRLDVNVLNPVNRTRDVLGLTNAHYMTGITCNGRTTSISKDRFANPSFTGSMDNVTLVKSGDPNNEYSITPDGTITLTDESAQRSSYGTCSVAVKVRNVRDNTEWTSSGNAVVKTYLIMGVCMRADYRTVTVDSKPGRMLVFVPCIYRQNNSAAFTYGGATDADRLYSYAGSVFSWMNTNMFVDDNVKWTKVSPWTTFLMIGSIFATASFIFTPLGIAGLITTSGFTWSSDDILHMSTIYNANTIHEPMLGRAMHEPEILGLADEWTWAIPTFLGFDLLDSPSGMSQLGLGLAETKSADNPMPMVTATEPLFELVKPRGNEVLGNGMTRAMFSCSGGNILFNGPGSGGIYVNLGASPSYSAFLDNSYQSSN